MMTTSLATVAVIGSGTMGAGIAEVAAAAGHPVRIFDINPKAVDLAIEGIAGRLASRVARGQLASEQADALLARLHPAHDLAALADADLVIEAASERLEVKTALFAQLAAICAPSTLLTSNTSSISITAIAAGVKNPERVAGLHFFNPAAGDEAGRGGEWSCDLHRSGGAAVPVRKRLGETAGALPLNARFYR